MLQTITQTKITNSKPLWEKINFSPQHIFLKIRKKFLEFVEKFQKLFLEKLQSRKLFEIQPHNAAKEAKIRSWREIGMGSRTQESWKIVMSPFCHLEVGPQKFDFQLEKVLQN